jgi:hypothetical protein
MYLNATYNCVRLGLCTNYKLVNHDITWFQRQTLLSTPPRLPATAITEGRTLRVVQLGDIHVDNMYTPVLLVPSCIEHQHQLSRYRVLQGGLGGAEER